MKHTIISIMTFSTDTLSIMTFKIMTPIIGKFCLDECHYTECRGAIFDEKEVDFLTKHAKDIE